jgi:hypothetical protein
MPLQGGVLEPGPAPRGCLHARQHPAHLQPGRVKAARVSLSGLTAEVRKVPLQGAHACGFQVGEADAFAGHDGIGAVRSAGQQALGNRLASQL